MERLRARFPDTLVLGFDPQGGSTERLPDATAAGLPQPPDDLDVCCGFLEHVRGREPDGDERRALGTALDNVRLQEASL